MTAKKQSDESVQRSKIFLLTSKVTESKKITPVKIILYISGQSGQIIGSMFNYSGPGNQNHADGPLLYSNLALKGLMNYTGFNPFKPEFAIVIFIHYKPRIAVAILDCCRNSRLVVDENDFCGLKIKENCHVLVNQFYGNFISKTLGCRKIKSVFRDVK